MSKLYLNESSIQATVINHLDSSVGYLNRAIDECNLMNIPSDFDFYQYLVQLKNSCRSLITNISTKREILQESIKLYKNVEKINVDYFSSIKKIHISVRKNIIE